MIIPCVVAWLLRRPHRAQLKDIHMLKNNLNEQKSPRARARWRFKAMKKKILKALELPKLNDADREAIRTFCGYGSPNETFLASDMELRWIGARALKDAMIAHRKLRDTDKREYYFGTLIDDSGITSDRVPLVRICELRDKVYRLLKSLGLNAICVIEVHPLMNHPGGGEGRLLLFHAHFVAWSDNLIDADAIAKEVNASSAWNCALGADPLNIKKIGPDKCDLLKVCYYLLKPPHSAKNRMPSESKEGAYRLMDTTKGYRPELALRVVEGLSQIDLRDTIFGVNEGASIRQEVRSAIQRAHHERLKQGSPLPSSFDVWQFWYMLRKRFGSANYIPYRIQGKGIFPAPTKLRSPAPKRRRGSNQRRLAKRPKRKLRRKTL